MTPSERELVRSTLNAIDSCHIRAKKRLLNAMALLDDIPMHKEELEALLKEEEGEK